MVITLGSKVIVSMGFRPLTPTEPLNASFTRLLIYEARGITLSLDSTVSIVGVIGTFSYKVWISSKINDGFLAEMRHTFIENEEEWRTEKGTNGPFLVVQIGPTKVYSISEGFVKTEEDGSFTTLDSFPDMRSELDIQESIVLPRLLTALVCNPGWQDRMIDPRILDRINVGETSSGEVLQDIRFQGNGSGFISRSITESELITTLASVVSSSTKLNKKSARFFSLGISEQDELKRFLYFFLAIEIATHASFKSIDQAKAVQAMLTADYQPHSALSNLLNQQTKSYTNLFDRFIWCAAHKWREIGDSEISSFKELKKIRDDIAHGSIATPPQGAAEKCQTLVMKVLNS